MSEDIDGQPSTGIGRVTKKVRRRSESSLEVEDLTVDCDGRKFQGLVTAGVSYKASLLGDNCDSGTPHNMVDYFVLQDGDVVTKMVDGVPRSPFRSMSISLSSVKCQNL